MSRDRPTFPHLRILNDDDPRGWESRVGTALLALQARIERRVAAGLAPHHLSIAQFDVLATLWHGEGITQAELADRLLVTKGNIVGLVDRTGAAGWVERRDDPIDRRINRLYLTDAGRAVVEAAFPCQVALFRSIFGTLTEPELRLLSEWIDRIARAGETPP